MLELDNLHIALKGFQLSADFSIRENRSTAILGPSGGGKSTLLMALAGFTPHSGQIRWRGHNISGLPPSNRPISMLFQENNLFPQLSIAQNVGLGLRPDLRLSAQDKSGVEEALARVGLEGRGADLPKQLSGGERQRVALARTVLRQKPIWLLDEPFAALGPALRRDMLDLVEDIRKVQSATLLLVTHAPEDARHIAKSCIFIDKNKALPPVETERFFSQPAPGFKDYLG
ncbi:MAG: ATP-binding cassette domain-containing protein [Rhodobacteraceae bacterium]|nr:ATP-binding cassette domain-containing protein [Paracoccaceae bacterium]